MAPGQQAWPQGSPESGPSLKGPGSPPGPVRHVLSPRDQPCRPAPVSPGAQPWDPPHPVCPRSLLPAGTGSLPSPSPSVHPLSQFTRGSHTLWPGPAPQHHPHATQAALPAWPRPLPTPTLLLAWKVWLALLQPTFSRKPSWATQGCPCCVCPQRPLDVCFWGSRRVPQPDDPHNSGPFISGSIFASPQNSHQG